MNQEELLVNMARYIHAIYDVDVGVDDPKLNIKLKKYVEKLGPTDQTLQSYWNAYVAALSGKTVIQQNNGSVTLQEPQTEQRETSIQQQTQENTRKKGIIYRGQKL